LSLRRAAPGLLLAVATVALFVVSRGKWSDPLIDSGREWIVPDALSRGQLLYRDVAYWFGPFTPYLHAAFFRVFGSSFTTLVAAGCVGAAAALVALYAALRRVTGPDSDQALLWTALAIPALVFMPNAGGAILGMGYRIWHAAAFALLAIAVASGEGRGANRARIAGAGALAALAGLCRTEWGLAALSAAALVLALRVRGREAARAAAILAAGFLLVFGGVWALFLALAGAKAIADQPIFLLNIPETTRGHVGLAGMRAWRTGIWNLLYSASTWLAVALGVAIVALRGEGLRANRRRLYGLGAALLVAALCAAMGAVPGPVLFSAAPLACLAALVAGWRGARMEGSAYTTRATGATSSSSSVALAGFGWMGLLASHRRFFFIGDAPYVAPPLLFAFVCAAGLIVRAVARRESPAERGRLAGTFAAAIGALVVFAFVGRMAGYASEERVAIRGTGGMLSARPDLARDVEETAAAIRREAPAGAGLVVVPEGEVLNFLSGRPNPARRKLYLPGYLTDANGPAVIADLERSRPGAIVRWLRPTGEYERGLFGTDYGRDVAAWIDAHYVAVAIAPGARAGTHPAFTLLVLRGRPS
jgi:hypothetical protein